MNSFEDLLADVQAEMVAVALEYSSGVASDILIFATADGGMIGYDPFFIAGGKVVPRHKLVGVDTSIDRQSGLLDYGNQQLIRLREGCKTFGRPMPTVFKLHYNVGSRSLNSDFSYEPPFDGPETATPLSLREAWQAEIQSRLEA